MHCPRLTSIKQSADYTGFIYIDFGMIWKLVVGPYTFCELGECHGSFSILLIDFISMDRLSVMVDPRYTNS